MRTNYCLSLTFLLFASYFLADTAQAQTDPNIIFDTKLYDGMKFRNVGPYRGGRSTAVAGYSDRPFEFLMGTTGGGVWRTDDAGTNWKNISDGSSVDQ